MITIISFGCEKPKEKEPLNRVKNVQRGNIQVLEVDSCEYVVWDWFDTGGIVHKQNCKYCIDRNK